MFTRFHPAESILSLKNISVCYGKFEALHNVSLHLYPNEIVSIIGPNGAGKSTLVKVILGLIKPTTGSRRVNNAGTMAYVPQKLDLNISLPMRVIDLLSLESTDKSVLVSVAEQIGISGMLQRSIHSLSGGQLQKVLIARALMRSPTIIILDEPTQGLDSQAEQLINSLIAQLPLTNNCSVVVISHDVHWVMQSTQRVICLNKHICCAGTPAQVQNSPEYSLIYGARSLYQHQHSHCSHTDSSLVPSGDA